MPRRWDSFAAMAKRRQTTTKLDQRRPKSAFYEHYKSLPADTDFSKHPELYRIGRGEQGVLMVEPYKSQLVAIWRFATPEVARVSADALYERFLEYVDKGDIVGADMARKFIQMGYTRARRYANYPGGRKYQEDGAVRERQIDQIKAESAAIFMVRWKQARENPAYLAMKRTHQAKYG